MSIEFRGLEEVIDRLDKIQNPKKMEEALSKAALLVERSAIQNAPKGSGELRRSIKSKVENMEGIVYSPLEYAPYVEYGTGLFAEDGGGRKDVPWHYQDIHGEWHSTSGREPTPYMRPALNENKEKIIKLLKEGLVDD